METYYSTDGSLRKTVESHGGSFVRSESRYFLNQLSFVIPLLGFLAALVATVHKMASTRAFFTWQLSRYGADHVETVLYLYAIPLFLSGVVFPILWRRAG